MCPHQPNQNIDLLASFPDLVVAEKHRTTALLLLFSRYTNVGKNMGEGNMSPFVLQQSKKATWLVLKIIHLENLVLRGVAHNLVLHAILYEHTTNNSIYIDSFYT